MLSSETGCYPRRSSNFRRAIFGIVVLTAGIAVFPNSVYGHDHDEFGLGNSNEIQACVQRSSNEVRIVNSSLDCKRSEVWVHWAIVGNTGARGPMGPAGPVGNVGPAGPAGPTGPRGPQGAAGPAGAAGPTGPQGPQGEAGLAGAAGPAGPQGPQGMDGATGPTGPAGPQGPKGESAMIGFAISQGLPNVQIIASQAVNTWFPLANRVVTLDKTSDSSKLRITYQDTLGAKATTFDACRWHIVIDGIVVSSFSEGDLEIPSFGWRIHNSAHMAWGLGFSAGRHTIQVEGLRTPNGTECLSGWNTTGNFLSVEEIP